MNCSTDDVAILVSAGKLQALGKPKPNAVKYFSAIELISLLADPDWLDDATKTIGNSGGERMRGAIEVPPGTIHWSFPRVDSGMD